MYIYIYKADQIILDNNPPIIHIIYKKKTIYIYIYNTCFFKRDEIKKVFDV